MDNDIDTREADEEAARSDRLDGLADDWVHGLVGCFNCYAFTACPCGCSWGWCGEYGEYMRIGNVCANWGEA